MLSVVGDVPVDNEACGDFMNLMICQLSPSEALIGVELAYVCS
jgi:hypothetical protein